MYLDDELSEEEYERLVEAARTVLRERGVMTAADLASALTGEGYGLPDDGEELIADLLVDEPSVIDLPDDRLVLVDAICEGLTLTHRLTSEEAAGEPVVLDADLAPLLMLDVDTFPMPTGVGIVSVLYPGQAGDEVTEGHRLWQRCALAGPPGWLGGARAGDLMMFRLDGGVLSVAPAPSALADGKEAAALLAEAFEWCTEDGNPVEVAWVLAATLVDAPDLFRIARSPLGELYELAGLEGRDEWVGEAGQDWDAPFDFPIGTELAEALGLDEPEAEALGILLSCYELVRSRGPEGLETLAAQEEALEGLGIMLSLPAVADLFLASVLTDDLDEAPQVAAFVETIAAVVRAPGPEYLLACCAEQRQDLGAAEAHLREALDIDPEFSPALIDAAWYASDRGDAKAALTYLRRAGVPADDGLVVQMERFAAPGSAATGRNDRCPCGSGRKYKVCCVRRNGHTLQDRFRWLHQKAGQFLMRRPQRDAVLDVAAARAGVNAEEDVWAHLAMEDALVQDLALFDRDVFTAFLDVRGALLPADELELGRSWVGIRRSLYEVAGVHDGRRLTLRDLRGGGLLDVDDPIIGVEIQPGDLLYARVAPDGRTHQLLGGSTQMPPELRDELIAFLDTDPGPEETAAWLTENEAPVGG